MHFARLRADGGGGGGAQQKREGGKKSINIEISTLQAEGGRASERAGSLTD